MTYWKSVDESAAESKTHDDEDEVYEVPYDEPTFPNDCPEDVYYEEDDGEAAEDDSQDRLDVQAGEDTSLKEDDDDGSKPAPEETRVLAAPDFRAAAHKSGDERDQLVRRTAAALRGATEANGEVVSGVVEMLRERQRDPAWFDALYDDHKPAKGRPPATNAAKALTILASIEGIAIPQSDRSHFSRAIQAAFDEADPTASTEVVTDDALGRKSSKSRARRDSSATKSTSDPKSAASDEEQEPIDGKGGEVVETPATTTNPERASASPARKRSEADPSVSSSVEPEHSTDDELGDVSDAVLVLLEARTTAEEALERLVAAAVTAEMDQTDIESMLQEMLKEALQIVK